jgi:hypothetical protein
MADVLGMPPTGPLRWTLGSRVYEPCEPECVSVESSNRLPRSHLLFTPSASHRFLNGPGTGSPDGPMSAHQQCSTPGSVWLAPKAGGADGREGGARLG